MPSSPRLLLPLLLLEKKEALTFALFVGQLLFFCTISRAFLLWLEPLPFGFRHVGTVRWSALVVGAAWRIVRLIYGFLAPNLLVEQSSRGASS
jgi:hypothetical protein